MDRFALLVADLGALINVPLHLDTKRMCRLSINQDLHVQIQEEEEKERLLIATFIGNVPPGKYRENVFKETLKENNLFPRMATFAYSERNNQLALFTHLYLANLSGDKLADFLGLFFERAFSWKTALETGQWPRRGETVQKTGPSIFDIKKL
jgi:hypothetical protein